MCEFRVFLKKKDREEMVAEDIVYAKVERNSIVLKGVLRNEVRVDDVKILEVDVEAERLVLTPSL